MVRIRLELEMSTTPRELFGRMSDELRELLNGWLPVGLCCRQEVVVEDDRAIVVLRAIACDLPNLVGLYRILVTRIGDGTQPYQFMGPAFAERDGQLDQLPEHVQHIETFCKSFESSLASRGRPVLAL